MSKTHEFNPVAKETVDLLLDYPNTKLNDPRLVAEFDHFARCTDCAGIAPAVIAAKLVDKTGDKKIVAQFYDDWKVEMGKAVVRAIESGKDRDQVIEVIGTMAGSLAASGAEFAAGQALGRNLAALLQNAVVVVTTGDETEPDPPVVA